MQNINLPVEDSILEACDDATLTYAVLIEGESGVLCVRAMFHSEADAVKFYRQQASSFFTHKAVHLVSMRSSDQVSKWILTTAEGRHYNVRCE